jgi:hypothetical protein
MLVCAIQIPEFAAIKPRQMAHPVTTAMHVPRQTPARLAYAQAAIQKSVQPQTSAIMLEHAIQEPERAAIQPSQMVQPVKTAISVQVQTPARLAYAQQA